MDSDTKMYVMDEIVHSFVMYLAESPSRLLGVYISLLFLCALVIRAYRGLIVEFQDDALFRTMLNLTCYLWLLCAIFISHTITIK